jgi:hypothetical protein
MLVIRLSEMHEVSLTPLSDCTVLTRSTRIRRGASALHAAIRNKRGSDLPLWGFLIAREATRLRRKEA